MIEEFINENRIRRRIVAIVFTCLVIWNLSDFFLNEIDEILASYSHYNASFIFSFLLLPGLLFLYRFGSFYFSKYNAKLQIGFAFYLLGKLLKIMHWPFSAYFFLAGFFTISFFYGLYFINKTKRDLLSLLKVLWVLFYSFFFFVKQFHVFSVPGVLLLIIDLLFMVILLWSVWLWAEKEFVDDTENEIDSIGQE